MNWAIWGPAFTALALIVPPLIQAAGKKLLARINSIPDERQRRQATADEHALEMQELAEHRAQHEAMLEAITELSANLTAAQAEAMANRLDNRELRAQSVQDKARIASLECQLAAALTLGGKAKIEAGQHS